MAEDNKERLYTDELQKVSDMTEPTNEDYDRLLERILSAVGRPKAASYTDARERVNRLSNLGIVYTARRTITSKAGAVVVAAGLLLAILVGRSLSDEDAVVIPDEEIPLSSRPSVGDTLPPEDRRYRVSAAEESAVAVESYLVEDDVLWIYVAGGGSGIAWETLEAKDLHGEPVRPAEVDVQQGAIGLALPVESLEVSLMDLAGAPATIYVTVY